MEIGNSRNSGDRSEGYGMREARPITLKPLIVRAERWKNQGLRKRLDFAIY